MSLSLITFNIFQDKNKPRKCSTSALKAVVPEPATIPETQIQEPQDTDMVEIIPVDDGEPILNFKIITNIVNYTIFQTV